MEVIYLNDKNQEEVWQADNLTQEGFSHLLHSEPEALIAIHQNGCAGLVPLSRLWVPPDFPAYKKKLGL